VSDEANSVGFVSGQHSVLAGLTTDQKAGVRVLPGARSAETRFVPDPLTVTASSDRERRGSGALCSAPHSLVTSYSGQPGPGDGWSIRSATGGSCSGT
jgi:hypothetical protein